MAERPKGDRAVEAEVKVRLEEIQVLKEMARERGLAFSSLTDEQLERKIRGETSKSPYSYAQSWTSGTSFGAPAYYNIYVSNPDPTNYFPFYATIFFGLGNVLDLDAGWAGRDTRWPAVSSDRTYLSPSSTVIFAFSYTTPTGLPAGTYNGNSVIWQGDWHDVGNFFDRGSFDVKLS